MGQTGMRKLSKREERKMKEEFNGKRWPSGMKCENHMKLKTTKKEKCKGGQ